MKIHSILFGFTVAAVGIFAAIGVVPEANAAGFSTRCTPIGGGWAQCVQTFCSQDQCWVTDSWTQPVSEAIIFE